MLELQANKLAASITQREHQGRGGSPAQANRVAAWFAEQQSPLTGPVVMTDWGAVIRNDSDLPVLSVRVFFDYIQPVSTVSEEWQPINRGGPPERIRVLPPHSEKFVPIPGSIRSMIGDCDDDVYAVSIEFIDAAGNRWERNARGSLEPL